MDNPEHTPLTDEIVNALADGAVLSGQKHGAFVDVAAFTTKRVPLGDHASVIVHMARDLAESRRLLRALKSEAYAVVSLERSALVELVGLTNVRCLDIRINEAADYFAACEGTKHEE